MKKLFLQAIKFFGYSGIGWVLDFCAYTLLGQISSNLILNNTISSWIGVTFVFIFATRKIFKDNSHIPLIWKCLIYLLYQAVLIIVMSKLLDLINVVILAHTTAMFFVRYSYIMAKILVTPITMVLNFIVMKSVIEKL